jgi:hypothetical protein
MSRVLLLSLLASALLLSAVPAQAQWAETDVPQTFWFEIGGFRVASKTNLSLSGEIAEPGDEIDFEKELDIPSTTTQGFIEFLWRPARRHQISLNWQRINREGNELTLDERLEWEDIILDVGARVQSRTESNFISGVYRFALIKNEKLELGPALGVGYVKIRSGLRGDLGVSIGDETASVPFDTEAEVGSITGDIGGYLYWWPGERFLVRSDGRYIAVGLEEADAAITEARASLTWFPWRKVGFGVQYAYTKFRYERNKAFVGLGGTYQYDGLQLLVNVAF